MLIHCLPPRAAKAWTRVCRHASSATKVSRETKMSTETTSASAEVEAAAENLASADKVPPKDAPYDSRYKPANIRLRPQVHRSPNVLNESFETRGIHSGKWQRLYDYHKTAELVRTFATPAERIAFVSPYERDWTPTERKWHRVQHRLLYQTRKAWAVPPICAYFDCLHFYSFITHTHKFAHESINTADAPLTIGELKERFEKERARNRQLWREYYHDLNLPVASFEKRVKESLVCALEGGQVLTKEAADTFLRRLLDDAIQSLAHTNDFSDVRISHNPRCESFWVRSGFASLYEAANEITNEPYDNAERASRVIGDHRQKLGELAFTMRDEFVAQVRQRKPMKNVALFTRGDDGDGTWRADHTTPYNPIIYGLQPDADSLWQCPGYEPESEETHPYGRVAIKNVQPLDARLEHWRVQGMEEAVARFSCMDATATISLFNWLNAQAHCAGFTQFTDAFDESDHSFCSQLICSDGQRFWFSIYQLRTLAFNIEPDYLDNKRANRVVHDGIHVLWKLYEPNSQTFIYADAEGKPQEGLNPVVLQYILKMLLVK